MTFNPLRFRAQALAMANVQRTAPEEAEPGADESLHLQLLGLEKDVKRLRDLPRVADRITAPPQAYAKPLTVNRDNHERTGFSVES